MVPKRSVTPGFFDVLGIGMVAGRGFRADDNLENWKAWPVFEPGETPYVCIVNQALADRCFPNSNAVGRTVRVGPWMKRPCQIVGVSANTRTETLTQTAGPEIYIPFLQCPVFNKHLIVRAAGNLAPLIGAIGRELRAVNPTVAIEHVRTLDQIRAESMATQLFAMRLLIGFSFTGCVLALVGIYSVLSLSVRSRRREIAIRMAVGAQSRSILGLVIGEGLQLVAIGLGLGAGVAIVLARVLQALLFEVEPTDAFVLSGVALLFGLVAMLACWVPARQATKVDPIEALRCE